MTRSEAAGSAHLRNANRLRAWPVAAMLPLTLVVVCMGCDRIFLDVLVSVTNSTSTDLLSLRVKGTSDLEWGENMLASNLAPGLSVELAVPKDIYDFEFAYQDDVITYLHSVDLEHVELYRIDLTEGTE